MRLDVDLKSMQADELLDYRPGWGKPGPADVEAITALMEPISSVGFFGHPDTAV